MMRLSSDMCIWSPCIKSCYLLLHFWIGYHRWSFLIYDSSGLSTCTCLLLTKWRGCNTERRERWRLISQKMWLCAFKRELLPYCCSNSSRYTVPNRPLESWSAARWLSWQRRSFMVDRSRADTEVGDDLGYKIRVMWPIIINSLRISDLENLCACPQIRSFTQKVNLIELSINFVAVHPDNVAGQRHFYCQIVIHSSNDLLNSFNYFETDVRPRVPLNDSKFGSSKDADGGLVGCGPASFRWLKQLT